MVRPIDLQDNFSKAPLASRLQQIQQDTAEMAHRQVSREMAQQQIVDRSRPLPAEGTQRGEVHPEGGYRHQEGQGRDKRRAPDLEEPSTATANGDGNTSHIDIVA